VVGERSACGVRGVRSVGFATSVAVISCAIAIAAGGAPASGAAACGRAPAESATLSIRQGSATRTAVVHVPLGYSAKKPLALVLNLHGSGSTAVDQRLFTGMSRAANAAGFVVAYPQGAIADGRGYDWNVPGQPLVGGWAPSRPRSTRTR
jgi:polyhydroxybutyrate depolymerase